MFHFTFLVIYFWNDYLVFSEKLGDLNVADLNIIKKKLTFI